MPNPIIESITGRIFSSDKQPKNVKVSLLVTILILLTALPLTITLVKQRQDIRQHAQDMSSVVDQIGQGTIIGSGDSIPDTLSYFIPTDPSAGYNGMSWLVTTSNKLYFAHGNGVQIYHWDNNLIYFDEDWHNNDFNPGQWMKRSWSVGDRLDSSTNTINSFSGKGDCDPNTNQQNFTFPYYTEIVAHISNFDVGGDIGVTDVIVLRYDYQSKYELFYFAKNHGFFYWEKRNADGSFVAPTTARYTFYNRKDASPATPFDCTRACRTDLQTDCTAVPTPTGTAPTTTTAPSGTGTPSKITGAVAAACTQIGGWTCDTSQTNQPLHVQFFLDKTKEDGGTLIGDMLADQVSGSTAYDQVIAKACSDDGKHQFYITLPDWLKDNNQHTLYAYGVSTDGTTSTVLPPGASNATTFTCSGSGSGTPTPFTTEVPTPTGSITPTPSGVITPTPSGTTLSLTLLLHGIGSGGDNKNKNSTGNDAPVHQTRSARIELKNADGLLILSQDVPFTYDTTAKNFTAKIGLGDTAPGTYTLNIALNQYLLSQSNAVTITADKNTAVPPITLVAGDINNDNILNVLDYNMILDCYSDGSPAKACDEKKKLQADINDDGSVDGLDYTLFIRELSGLKR